jgi:hypothetical protein
VSLVELEAARKRALLLSGVFFPLGGALILLLGPLGLFLGVPLVVLALNQISAFPKKAKQALVAPLAEALGFRYWADRGFSEEEILASGIFHSPDHYHAEDLVEGEVNGIPFTSSHITLYRKVEEVYEDRKRSYYQVFFSGVLYRFRLPFAVEKEVRFAPPGSGRGAYTNKRLERVVLESPEFNRFFEVFGEDQVEARKLLTPRVQEALVELVRHLRTAIGGAVRGRDLWLAVKAVKGRERFPKPPILLPVTWTYEAWKARYQDELSKASRVVEILRLEEEAKRRGAFLGGSEAS